MNGHNAPVGAPGRDCPSAWGRLRETEKAGIQQGNDGAEAWERKTGGGKVHMRATDVGEARFGRQIANHFNSAADVIWVAAVRSNQKLARLFTDRYVSRMAKSPAQREPTAYDRGFERCVVTFIDILGYKQLLATRHAADIVRVVRALRKFTEGDANDEAPPTRSDEVRLYTQSFSESVSDAVVRVRTIDTQSQDGPFAYELIDLMHAMIECVNQGILVRGGMTIGPVYIGADGKGPIFGEGMVRAYEIEEEEAVYPRIMIDDDALQAYVDDKTLWQDGDFDHHEARMVLPFIGIAEDGSHFVDYLRGSGPGEFDAGVAGQFAFLERHRAMIVKNLSTANAKARRKLVWLANYHNRFVEELRGRYDMTDANDAFFAELEVAPAELFASLMIEGSWTKTISRIEEIAGSADSLED